MDILTFQLDTVWENPSANFAQIQVLVSGCRVKPDSLLVFPELSTVGFSMDIEAVGESHHGETFHFFSEMASSNNCHVLAGISGRDDSSGLGLNEAVCFAPDGSEISRYRKVHPFPLAGEGEHYLAGKDAVVFELNGWKVAPVICYDLRFPELFRSAVKQGAEVFLVIANWPDLREDHWITLLRARAIENQAYVAGVNRCGSDPTLTYSGASLIVNPLGEVLAKSGTEPGVLNVPLDKMVLTDWRKNFPALKGIQI